MSQDEKNESCRDIVESETGKNSHDGKDEKPKKCRIHVNLSEWDDEDKIRQKVCFKDEDLIQHTDGNHYCLFHLPEKNKENFKAGLQKRLDEIEKSISDTEQFDEQKRKSELRNISYDFRYVYFSSEVDFKDFKFLTNADFSRATFSSTADFIRAIFSSDVYFNSTTFSSVALFISAVFSEDAFFYSATFSYTSFFSAKFSAKIYFDLTTFTSSIDFDQAKFAEDSQIFFQQTKFYSKVSFRKTEFDGFVVFEGDVFQIESDKNVIDSERGAFLSFEEARLNKPSRISFNSMKLRPCWFVNAEIRNLNFNDVEWLNTEIDIDCNGLKEELQELQKYRVQRTENCLVKAFNQLADNAEANRRFAEARQFRKNSIALNKNVVCHVHDSIDPEFKPVIRKKVCGRYPVVNEDAGKYYCLWHNPDKNKAAVFQKEFEKRILKKHRYFQGVVFPITVAYKITDKTTENKYEAKIIELPSNLDFSHATFQKRFILEDNLIHDLELHNVFVEKDAELIIKSSKCDGKIYLDKAVIEGKLFIEGKEIEIDGQEKEIDKEVFLNTERALSLYDARINKPEWINFRCVRLRPHYFKAVDASKFVFHNCEWKDAFGNELKIQDEISNSSNKQLTQICNELAINYEEDRNFEESTYFRYTAMQSKRLEKFLNGWFWTLDWLYWLSSGYGERRFRAFGVLIFIIGLFGFIYSTHLSTFENVDNSQNEIICGNKRIRGNAEGISVCHGMVHSLAVASFQRPDPKPYNYLTKFFVTFETILASLQAALLALAIRRKFMR